MEDENKKELLEAIDDYDAYPSKQKAILKLLISISVKNVAVIKPTKITELVHSTRATTYLSLTRLKDDQVILDNGSEQQNVYRLSPERLDEIIKSHRNKLEYSKKIT